MTPFKDKRLDISFVVIFMTLLTIGIVTWELIALPYSDDYYYFFTYCDRPGIGFLTPSDQPITTFGQAIDSFNLHYLGFNSRMANLFMYLSNILPTEIRDIICGVLIVTMLALIIISACGKRGLMSPLTVTSASTLMWIMLPWHDNLVSIDFQINYVLCVLPVLWFLYIYLYKISSVSRKLLIGTGFIAFFAGSMHEGMSIPALTATIAVYTFYPADRKRRLALMIPFIVGVAVCLGPGTFRRLFYGGEMNFDIAHYPQFVTRAISGLWQWLMPIGAMFYLAARRGWNTAAKLTAAEWPWMLMAIVNFVIGLLVLRMDRTLWMMDISLIVVTLKLLSGHNAMKQSVKLTISVVLAALNLTFISGLCVEQNKYANDQQFSIDMITEKKCRAIYTNLPLEDNAPWWTLGIPHRYDGRDDIAQFTFSSAMDTSIETFYPILPAKLIGKSFEQWPEIAGDNPFRGEYPNLYCSDSISAEISITVGEPLQSMNPVNRLITLVAGHPKATHVKLYPIMLWDGDSGKIYKYSIQALPRTIKSRRFISLDMEK